MSILLEALKKSERQRQLGQTPNLQSNLESPPPSRVSLNHWIPLSLLLLSLAVMSWFGWQQFRKPDASGAAELSPAVAQTADTPQPRTMTESFQPEQESGDEPSEPLAEVSTSEDENKRSRLNRSFNNFKAETEAETEQAEASAPPGDLAAAVVDLQQPQAENEAEALDEQAAEAKPEIETGTAPEALASRTRKSKTEAAPSILEPHISEPISYWELPQGIRDNLPEIKITVLVYSVVPSDRFLLTNGQRMSEKDELDSGLVLDEIRRDGAIFTYRNYRFLVKG